MRFNKLYAWCCGITTITILFTYFFNYYEALAYYSETIQLVIISISVLAFIASLGVLFSKFKLLFSKEYFITTIILLIISLLAVWFDYFLYTKI